jgi:hypothetical protein
MPEVKITFEMKSSTSENTYKGRWLMLRRELIALNSEKHTKRKIHSVSNIDSTKNINHQQMH